MLKIAVALSEGMHRAESSRAMSVCEGLHELAQLLFVCGRERLRLRRSLTLKSCHANVNASCQMTFRTLVKCVSARALQGCFFRLRTYSACGNDVRMEQLHTRTFCVKSTLTCVSFTYILVRAYSVPNVGAPLCRQSCSSRVRS